MKTTAEGFVSCDWGSSALRIRLVRLGPAPADCRVLAEHRSPRGVLALSGGRTLDPDEREAAFAGALAEGLAALPPPPPGWPVVISGMAGSSLGWRETPYAPLPWPGDGGLEAVPFRPVDERLAGRTCFLLPGVRSYDDVMRGEETEVLGLLSAGAAPPEGWLVLPGTHTKLIRLAGGRVRIFHTCITGELFALLTTHGSLREMVAGGGGDDGKAFADGVATGAEYPMSRALFGVRAAVLLGRRARGGDSRAFLGGLLLGAETAALRDLLARGEPVAVAAASKAAAARYRIAMTRMGLAERTRWIDTDAADRAAAWGQAAFLLSR